MHKEEFQLLPKKTIVEILKSGVVIPALPLPLDSGRRLDEQGERLLLRYYLDCGVGGIAAAVHTTQFEIREERYGLFEPVLRIASEEVEAYRRKSGRQVLKISGICGKKEQAVREAECAASLGYDAVLLSPGGLSDLDEDALIDRTEAVAGVLPVIGFYLQESVGGRRLSYDYWSRLCGVESVVAVKSAPFNRYQTLDVVRAAALSPRSEEIALYTGNDDNIVVDLLTEYSFQKDGKTYQKGFSGGLLGHWSVWTRKAVELLEWTKQAKQSGNIPAELLTRAAQVTDSNAAFFDTANGFKGCIAGIHEALRRQGLMKGIWCLNPEETLSPGQAEEITRVWEMYPHLNDDAFVAEGLRRWKE